MKSKGARVTQHVTTPQCERSSFTEKGNRHSKESKDSDFIKLKCVHKSKVKHLKGVNKLWKLIASLMPLKTALITFIEFWENFIFNLGSFFK